jgi:hypothetical protein
LQPFSPCPPPNDACRFPNTSLSSAHLEDSSSFGALHFGYLPFDSSKHLSGFPLHAAFRRSPVVRDFHEYYPDSVTMALSGGRPSHVPSFQYVLARRRCPIHPLQDPHWISVTSRKVPVAYGTQQAKKCHRLQAF